MQKCYIRELYYGNITPGDTAFHKHSAFGKLQNHVTELEESFRGKLDDKGVETYDELMRCLAEAHGVELADRFVSGFQLGARMMLEILYEPTERDLQEII